MKCIPNLSAFSITLIIPCIHSGHSGETLIYGDDYGPLSHGFHPIHNFLETIVTSEYTLHGVLVHDGASINSAHYYCFVRTSPGMWHSLDDNKVSQVSEKTVLDQKAYMLFYVRDKQQPLRSSDLSEASQNAKRKRDCTKELTRGLPAV